MMGDSSTLPAVLTVVSVVSLSLMSLLCLRCRKKSKIVQESQIYDQQIFQRGGSKFAVMRSKTVTRGYQMSDTHETLGGIFQEDQTEEQGEYQNITVPSANSSLEHDYVAPIAIDLYANEKDTMPEAEVTPGIYGNVFSSLSITEGAEEDDYENTAFLEQQMEQQMEDEPDYVNENGECT